MAHNSEKFYYSNFATYLYSLYAYVHLVTYVRKEESDCQLRGYP